LTIATRGEPPAALPVTASGITLLAVEPAALFGGCGSTRAFATVAVSIMAFILQPLGIAVTIGLLAFVGRGSLDPSQGAPLPRLL
jgi:hypothetical protein